MKETFSGLISVRSKLDKVMTAVTVFWVVFIGGILAFEYMSASSSVMDIALAGLKEAFNKDLAYRRWAAMHGGVYVPITEKMPPNPYLKHVPERDVITASGKRLTLMNPAYMTRQVQELGEQQYGLKGHITSLNPLRPGNFPDEWERQALLRFEKGEQEVWGLASINGQPFIRFMRPFLVEEGCLRCHGHQDIKPGDIGGGISVSAPWAPFRAALFQHMYLGILGFSSIFLVGLVGLAAGWHSLKKNLSEREQAEQTLRASEKRYRAIFDNAGVGIDFLDAEGNIIGVNHALAEMLGYTAEQIMGMSLSEITHPEDREISKRKLEALVSGEIDSYRIEKRYLTRTGAVMWADLSVSAIRDAEVKHAGIIGVIVDVTRNKQAEETLQERERWLRLALVAAKAAAWQWNLITNQTVCSEELWRLYGREPQGGEAALELWGTAVHPEDRAAAERAMQDAVSQGLDLAFQWRITTPDGSERWLMLRGSPILGNTGKPMKYIGIVMDISEQKRLEHALRSSQEILNATGRLAKVGGWEVDATTQQVTWTEETYRIHEVPTDYNPPLEETLSFYPEEDRERLSKAIHKALLHGEPYDMELRFTSAKGKHL